MHNLAHLFLNQAKVGILVYSIDNKTSYDNLSEWAEHLETHGEDLFTVIVGSKSDLADNRAVPDSFAKNLKNSLPNCKIQVETSAYENVESITSLFDQISREVIEGGYYN